MTESRTRLHDALAEFLRTDPRAESVIALLTVPVVTDQLMPTPALPAEDDRMRLEILGAYQRLTRETSAILHTRAMSSAEPMLVSPFADLAVSALMREAYLDVQAAAGLLAVGLDIQAAVILRHLWELELRALVVALDAEAAGELERATFASLEGEATAKRLERIRERAWGRALSPTEMMRRAARIEASLDITVDSVGHPDIDRRVKEMRAVYFGFLSDLAHGGSQMLIKSALRADEDTAPDDPLAALGRPTDWCSDLLAHALWLAARFWRSFLPGAAPLARGDLTEHERLVLLAALALDQAVTREFDELMWSGIEWVDDDEPGS